MRLMRALAFTAILLLLPACGQTQEITLDDEQQGTWARLWEEHQGHKLIMEFSARHAPGGAANTMALTGINVIPMTGENVLEGYTVITRDGLIAEIGPASEVDIPADAGVVAASNHYLVPGLVEAHSHTISSLEQFLVYLTRGVTTLREMDGWPWMLEARAGAAQNKLLIPNLYVTGHILSHRAWDFYMTQVNTEDQVRALVRQQAADGYDFIKVHNSMPEPLFSAMFEAADAAGLDVVGHIPNEILIADAVRLGMRTNEHFKGYLFDETLDITQQDYVAATAGSDLWNAPSFSNHHEHLRGEEALELVTEENSLRLVPRWLRNMWLEQARGPVDKLTALRQTIYPKSKKIFADLKPVTDKFFAGTDTGTYAFQVPGYALQEEVRIFESLGLSPFEALKTATVNSAIAMRKENEFGTIETGKRADLLLVEDNPLDGAKNLADIAGVMVRGVWLDAEDLREIESRLEEAFGDENEIPAPTAAALENLASEIEALKEDGFPYPDYHLEEVEALLDAAGLNDLAARVTALRRGAG